MLLRTLLQLSLISSDAILPDRLRQQLNLASEQDWNNVLPDLELHRLMPLVYYGVKVHGLTGCVPKLVFEKLRQSYIYSLGRNQIIFKTLGSVLTSIHAGGVYPVMWKGIVLADQLYPDRATRMIGDIDWAIAPHQLNTVSDVFHQLGFMLQEKMTTSDAVYFMGKNSVIFDVHHRVRLFETKEHLALTQNLVPCSVGLPNLQILDPTAMLTHLTVHMTGHRTETGPLLFWVLDFVFLLRKWGHLIEWDRLQQLMPDAESWMFLGRILRFLEVELNEPLPPELSKFARDYKPLTLELILRQCRLALWGLPHPRGWLKLMACRIGLKSATVKKYPRASDLVLWAADAVLVVTDVFWVKLCLLSKNWGFSEV
jgi:Uncharacterised nucleotidyltransferase